MKLGKPKPKASYLTDRELRIAYERVVRKTGSKAAQIRITMLKPQPQ